MKLHPRLSSAAVELVVRFETFHAEAQPTAEGGWTIGYGHIRSARAGGRISREDAQTLLLYDLAAAADTVEACLFAPVSQRQFEALNAFCFNIGADNFRCSTALARINAGAELDAADEIERWRRAELGAGPQVVDALVRRRVAEKAHFLGLPEGFAKSPRAMLRPLPGEQGQGLEPLPPAAASATLSAANSVQARLRELVPEPPPFAEDPPGAEDPTVAEDPLAAEDMSGSDVLAAFSPTSGHERGSVPQPEVERQPATPAIAAESLAPTPAPPPKIIQPSRPVRPDPAPFIAPPPPPPTSDVRVDPANDAAPAKIAPRPHDPAPSAPVRTPSPAHVLIGGAFARWLTARRVYAILAVVGACLFVVAAGLILSGRPTLANLVIGICSVGLMTPGVYGLLGPRVTSDKR